SSRATKKAQPSCSSTPNPPRSARPYSTRSATGLNTPGSPSERAKPSALSSERSKAPSRASEAKRPAPSERSKAPRPERSERNRQPPQQNDPLGGHHVRSQSTSRSEATATRAAERRVGNNVIRTPAAISVQLT